MIGCSVHKTFVLTRLLKQAVTAMTCTQYRLAGWAKFRATKRRQICDASLLTTGYLLSLGRKPTCHEERILCLHPPPPQPQAGPPFHFPHRQQTAPSQLSLSAPPAVERLKEDGQVGPQGQLEAAGRTAAHWKLEEVLGQLEEAEVPGQGPCNIASEWAQEKLYIVCCHTKNHFCMVALTTAPAGDSSAR